MSKKLRWDHVPCLRCGHAIPMLIRKCPNCQHVYSGDELTKLTGQKKGLYRLFYGILGSSVAVFALVGIILIFDDGSGTDKQKREAAVEVIKAVFHQTSTCNKADVALSKSVANSMADLSNNVYRSQLETDVDALWQTCLHTGSNVAKIPISSVFGEKLVQELTEARTTCADAYVQERAIAYWMKKFVDMKPTPERILAIDPNFDKDSLWWAYSIPHDKATALIKKCYRELNAATLQVGADVRQASKDFDAIYISRP